MAITDDTGLTDTASITLAGEPAGEQTDARKPLDIDHCRSCGSTDDDDMDVDNGLTLCCDAEIVSDCDKFCEHD